jgi:hypothetical protein
MEHSGSDDELMAEAALDVQDSGVPEQFLQEWLQAEASAKSPYNTTVKQPKAKRAVELVFDKAVIPSKTFVGSFPPWVFLTRNGVTGYHNDGMQARSSPTPIFLTPSISSALTDYLAANATLAEAPTYDTLDSTSFLDGMGNRGSCLLHLLAPAGRRCRHRRKPNGTRFRTGRNGTWKMTVRNATLTTVAGQASATAVNDESAEAGPTTFDALKVSCNSEHTTAEDSWWRKAGLWAIDSANANSSLTALPWIARSSADVCALQEMKWLGAQKMNAGIVKARQAKWTMHPTESLRTGAGCASGGMAVCARNGIGSSSVTEQVVPEAFRYRIAIAHVAAICRGGVHIATPWLRHSEGATEENLCILQVLADALHALRGPWVACGDWNLTPEALTATGWVEYMEAVIVCTDAVTCNSSVYDFFVVPRSFMHAVVAVQRIGECFKPHWPVRLLLCGDARRKMVMQLQRPSLIPAVLPFGPKLKPSVYSPTQSMFEWYALARSELRQLVCAKPGNVTSPTFVQVPAIGPIAAPNAGASWIAATWRIMHTHAAEIASLARRPSVYNDVLSLNHWNLTVGRAMAYRAPGPVRPLLVEWLKALWPLVVRRDIGNITLMARIALEHAKSAEATSLKAHFAKVKAWASNGLGMRGEGGTPTRAAFQWMRSPAGWIKPTFGTEADEEQVANEARIWNEVEGSTTAPATVVQAKPSLTLALGAQAEVNAIADGWAELWREKDQYDVSFPSNAGSSLTPITGDDLDQAAMTFPASTGRGG